MTFLWIFVLAAFTTFGFVQCEEERGKRTVISCPICEADYLQACDNNIRYKECWEGAVCAVSRKMTDRGMTSYKRYCSGRDEYNARKAYCDRNPSHCAVKMCENSRCKPDLPNSGGEGIFLCPLCEGDSLKACDDFIHYEDCYNRPDSVCGLVRNTNGGTTTYRRLCVGREQFNSAKHYCDQNPEVCAVGICDKSGCKAELPNSA